MATSIVSNFKLLNFLAAELNWFTVFSFFAIKYVTYVDKE